MAPCLPKASTATVVEKQTTVPNRDKDTYNNNGHTRLMPSYPAKVAHAHNLPSLEAPVRGMTIDPVRTLP